MPTTTIQETIYRQIGWDAILAVSARDFRSYDNTEGDPVLAFRYGSRFGLPQFLTITYDRGHDSYTVVAYKRKRNGDTVNIYAESGIYCDMLAQDVRDINNIGTGKPLGDPIADRWVGVTVKG